jgi:DNA-binding transcriptional MerR regulator/quercetin dioxygenase-like cupin family protein
VSRPPSRPESRAAQPIGSERADAIDGEVAAGARVRRAGRPGGDLLRIAEAARIVGTSASSLRQWERQGLLRPSRGRGGQRLYGPEDVDRAREIVRLRAARLNAPAIRRLLPGEPAAADGGTSGEWSVDAAGPQLRARRLARGMTLRDVAAATGLSSSFISSFERGLTGVSMAALQRLVAACGTTVAELLRGTSVSAGRVVRAGERRVVELGGPGIRMEDLSNAPTSLEGQLFVLAPGASSDGWYAHPGEELMLVLSGRVGVWLGEQEFYDLDEGDALTFPSTLSHRFRALASSETRLIWVNTPPTF